MKKIGVLLSLLVLSASAFALNAEYATAQDVQKKVVKAQREVQQYDSFKYTGAAFLEIIGTYEEVYLVDAEEATSLNQLLKQAIFTNAKGEKATLTSNPVKTAIDYAVEHGSSYAHTDRLGYFDEENVIDNFYRHLAEPYCPGKNQFETFAQNHSRDIVSQHIYETLVRPFADLNDQEATPLAKCYVTYKVKSNSLLNYVRADNNFPNSVSSEMEVFADRVEALAK